MPDPQNVSWITVSDFNAGIRQLTNDDNITAFSPHPPGVAAAVDSAGLPVTFGCTALPEGGLGPLPFAFASVSTGPAAPNNAQRVSSFYAVGGLHIPQYPLLDNTATAPVDECVVYTGLVYQLTLAAGTPFYDTIRYRMYALEMCVNVPHIDEIPGVAGTAPAVSFNPAGNAKVDNLGFIPMCDYRSATPNPATTPGAPRIIFGVADPYFLNNTGGTLSQDGALAHLTAYTPIANLTPWWLVGHQGRLVVNGNTQSYAIINYNAGGDVQVISCADDDTYWTQVNQDALDNAGADSAFSQQVLGTYGCISSSSASELLIIRATAHGGLTVSSDLNSPVVTDYPALQGTNGCLIQGCWTPVGYVYGAKDGSIYLYPGGGRSVDIAPNMENGFWHQNLVTTIGAGNLNGVFGLQTLPIQIPHFGKMAYLSGYVFIPGNWLYDISANAWWRFQTTPDPLNTSDLFNHHWFATSPLGSVYSAPARWIGTGGNKTLIARARFDVSSGPASFQWTSQPIPISQHSEINEAIEFVIRGISTSAVNTSVQATLTAYPSGNTITLPASSFTNAGTSQAFRYNLPSLQGTHVVVKIVVSGQLNTIPCPIIESFDIGVAPLNLIQST